MSSDDDEPLLDEVMTALEGALGDLDVQALRDAVKQGLEEAAHALEGRGEEQAVADNVVTLGAMRDQPEDSSESEGVQVRVVGGGTNLGRIRVSEGWQTVWSGSEPVPYRLSLSRGQLEVVVDDQTVAQLQAGQTCDVGGRTIRVRGHGNGHYRRL